MKYLLIVGLFVVIACNNVESEKESSAVAPVNWQAREVELPKNDSLEVGSTYLSIYSEVYSRSQNRTQGLTSTISVRNMNPDLPFYVMKADYHNTDGDLVRAYVNKPVLIKPLETIEIVVQEVDNLGGTGGNFMFDWAIQAGTTEPLFECVMISTSGQQGISFLTKGVRIK